MPFFYVMLSFGKEKFVSCFLPLNKLKKKDVMTLNILMESTLIVCQAQNSNVKMCHFGSIILGRRGKEETGEKVSR